MLKRWMFLIVLLLMIPSYVFAQDIPEKPTTAGYVFDYQDVIDEEVEAEINEIARLLQSEGIMELMVVTVPTIGEMEPYEYGMQFFREWGIGDTEKDNGLLIYATTDMGEGNNVVRISIGYGLEGDYPDSVTNDLIQNYMQSALEAGNYTSAFAQIVQAIAEWEQIDYAWTSDYETYTADTNGYYEDESIEHWFWGLPWIITVPVMILIPIIIVGGVMFSFAIGFVIAVTILKHLIRSKKQREAERLAEITLMSKIKEALAMGFNAALNSFGSGSNSDSGSGGGSDGGGYSYGGGDSGGGGSDSRF